MHLKTQRFLLLLVTTIEASIISIVNLLEIRVPATPRGVTGGFLSPVVLVPKELHLSHTCTRLA